MKDAGVIERAAVSIDLNLMHLNQPNLTSTVTFGGAKESEYVGELIEFGIPDGSLYWSVEAGKYEYG